MDFAQAQVPVTSSRPSCRPPFSARLHFGLAAMDSCCAAGPVAPHLLDLRRTVGLCAPHREGVLPFLEGPVVTPEDPGRFRQGRPQRGLFPRAAVDLHLNLGYAARPGEGDAADGTSICPSRSTRLSTATVSMTEVALTWATSSQSRTTQ